MGGNTYRSFGIFRYFRVLGFYNEGALMTNCVLMPWAIPFDHNCLTILSFLLKHYTKFAMGAINSRDL